MKNCSIPLSLPPLIGFTLVLLASSAIRRPVTAVHASSVDTPSGAVLFREKGCEHCHGVDGVGITNKGPSLLTVGKRLKKDAIARQIHDGGDSMPAFGESLQPDEIKALVDMLSKKKKLPKDIPKPVKLTPSIQPENMR
jgi:mono/diheme cytochrome c family protein